MPRASLLSSCGCPLLPYLKEVPGLEVIQTNPFSFMIRKGTNHTYAVVETGTADTEMHLRNHNGLEVGSPEEVDALYELRQQVKEWSGVGPARGLERFTIECTVLSPAANRAATVRERPPSRLLTRAARPV